MKIAHVVVTDAWAGVEAHVARLARAQAESGHEVAIIGGSVREVPRHAGPGVLFAHGSTVRSAWSSLRSLPWTPTVIHAHMTAAELAGTLYPPVLRGARPMVVTRHLALPRGNSAGGRVASTLIRRRVAGQIAISSHTAAHIDGASTVILAGVDSPAIPAEPGRSTTVLIAARLEAEKRVDIGIRAFARSGLDRQGWRLAIAGEGACRAEIERLASDLSVAGSVDLLGYRADVRELMLGAGIFLAPTPAEGLGLSVIEAMAAGLPVIADGSGGHLESMGDEGRPGLYRTQDPEDAGLRLRTLGADPDVRRSYGRELRRRQERTFTLKAQVDATDEFYRSVLG